MSRSFARHVARLLTGALLLGLGALASVPRNAGADLLEIDAPPERLEVTRSPQRRSRHLEDSRWRRFAERNPAWIAAWNSPSATALRLQGPGIFLAERPAGASEADRAIRRLLDREASAWIGTEDLSLVRAARFRDSWWVTYAQTHHGLRVVGGRVTVRAAADGSVPLMDLDVRDAGAVDTTPVLGEMEARVAALAGFAPDVEADPGAAELVVLPREGRRPPRLAWEIGFRTREPLGAWVAWVDAGDGTVLRRVNRIRFADLGGNVSGRILPLQATDSQIQRSQRYLDVSLVEGGEEVAAGTTSPSGFFSLPDVPAGEHLFRVLLGGPYGVVINNWAGNEVTTVEVPVDPGTTGNLNVVFDDTNSRVQDRNAYHWAMVSRDRIRGVEADFDLLDYPMPIVTDLANQSCNAFWDGTGINFFPAGSGCANTAMSASVVIHEYGHGITDHQYRPFFPNGAMHEGFSDYFSATLLNDPVIGHGFRGPGTAIRRIDLDRVWPDDVVDEVHTDGLIIAGALWDVRTILGATLADSLWHYARYGYSDNFDDYFLDYLLTDDDDGNIYNGTPHFDTIVEAFRRHGIGDVSVSVAHLPLRDSEDTGKTFPIRASFLSLFPLDETSVQVHVEVERGGETATETRVLEPTGGIREFETVLGEQLEGTRVRYWFTASDVRGNSVVWPSGGSEAPFTFDIGADTEPPVLVHEALPDQPAKHDAVRIRATVTDNLDLGVASPRVVFSLNGGEESELAMVSTGEDRFEAVIPMAAPAPGDAVAYRIEVEDLAATPNRTVEPSAGVHAFTLVRGESHDFEVDDGGLAATPGWEWGTPTFFTEAWSGERLWATGIDGVHENDADETLVLGPLDLSAFERAGLFFRHRYQIEGDYDGGSVQVSIDGGATWDLIVPDGEYPYDFLWATGEPGFSGDLGTWSEAAFDLTRFLGEPDVRIRFRFASDVGLVKAGWYLDDLAVVERQVLARPLRPEAWSGRDGIVPLAWEPPAGVPIEDPRAGFLGYRVYRSIAGGPFELRTPEPLAEPVFVDEEVENGVFLRYRVTAAYEEGESLPAAEVEAIAYVASYAAKVEEIGVTVLPGASEEVEIALANPGTGFLKLALWPALEGQTLDDVRIRYETGLPGKGMPPAAVPGTPAGNPGEALLRSAKPGFRLDREPAPQGAPPTGEYEVLFTDGDDIAFAAIPDLRTLEAQVENESLYLRLTAHETWVDPNRAFTLAVAFDVDGVLEEGSFGDYTLLAGAAVRSAFGVLAILLDADFQPILVPHHLFLNEGRDAAEFGIPLEALGSPGVVLLTAAALDRTANTTYDLLPDAPALPWLSLSARYLEVFQGEEAILALGLDGAAASEGVHEARLLLETNDPDRPEVSIPITFEVKDETAVTLVEFHAASAADGVELKWRVADPRDHAGFHLYRTEVGGGPEIRLNDLLLTGDSRGNHRFVDPAVVDGREYRYRLADVDRAGRMTFHPATTIRYAASAGLAHPVLSQSFPNPLRTGTTIRFGLPEAGPVSLQVIGADGRLVRSLAMGELFDRGFHQLAWDGRDDQGRPVAAGVYATRLLAGGREVHRKLVVVR